MPEGEISRNSRAMQVPVRLTEGLLILQRWGHVCAGRNEGSSAEPLEQAGLEANSKAPMSSEAQQSMLPSHGRPA